MITILDNLLSNMPAKDKENLKPIEFKKYLDQNTGETHETTGTPQKWENVILLNQSGIYDVMMAYDDHPDDGYIYLGHWNDGVQ